MILRTLVLALALGGVAAAQEIRTPDLVTKRERASQKPAQRAAGSVAAIKVDREPEADRSKSLPIPGMRRFGGMQPPADAFAKRPVGRGRGDGDVRHGTVRT